MKLSKFLFIFLFFNSAFTLNSQSTKNITDFLNLETGCPLPEPSKNQKSKKRNGYAEEVEVSPEDFIDTPTQPKKEIIPPVKDTPWKNNITSYLQNLSPKKATKKIEGHLLFQDEYHLWGIKNAAGKIIVSPCFEVVHIPKNNQTRFVGKKIGEKGFNVFDKNGKAILKKNYQHIYPYFGKDHIPFHSKGKQGMATTNGKVIIQPKYDIISGFKNGWKVKKDGLFGVLDKKGKSLIPPKYKYLNIAQTDDDDVYTFVAEKNGDLTIYKNKKVAHRLGIKYYEHAASRIFENRYLFYGNKLIDLKKKQFLFCDKKIKVERHQDVMHLFTIKLDKDYWVFNEKGEMFFDLPIMGKPQYLKFENGVAIAGLKTQDKDLFGFPVGKGGLLNKNLDWDLPPNYRTIERIKQSNLYIAAKIGQKIGIIDSTGAEIIPATYLRIEQIGEKLYGYKKRKSNLVDVLDKTGKKISETNMDYTKVNPYYSIYTARRKKDNKKVILDHQFNEIYHEKYYNMGSIVDGKAIWIEKTGSPKTYDVIDYSGNPLPLILNGQPRSDITEIKYYWKTPFFRIKCSDESTYIFNKNTESGFLLNDEINEIDASLYSSYGLLISIRTDGKNKGLIDKSGKEILPPNFKNIAKAGPFIHVRTDDRSHTFTPTGKELFKEYDYAGFLYHNFFVVKKDGKAGVVNIKGDIIIPLKYRAIWKDSIFNLKAKTLNGREILLGLDGVEIPQRKN